MRTLVSTIRCPMDSFHRAQIELIDKEDYSGVLRKAAEDIRAKGCKMPYAYCEEGVLALKQYYAVALLDPKNEHAVSDAIDPFWHAHILHTRRYEVFCERVYGQFIHHEPLDHADRAAVAHVGRLYRHTQHVYTKLFNYVNIEFFPASMPDVRLICCHYRVDNETVGRHALFDPGSAEFRIAA